MTDAQARQVANALTAIARSIDKLTKQIGKSWPKPPTNDPPAAHDPADIPQTPDHPSDMSIDPARAAGPQSLQFGKES